MDVRRPMRIARLGLLGGVIALLAACGGSAGTSQAPSTAGASAQPAASTATGANPSPADGGGNGSANPGSSVDNGPIGGDIGDRSKGSVKAQVTGGLTATIDLPFGAALANFGINGPNSAYLPYTDPNGGTLFLTITDGQLVIVYAGPNNVGLANGSTPCELKVDALDGSQAKGSFTCKGLTLLQGETIGSADITGTFEAHK